MIQSKSLNLSLGVLSSIVLRRSQWRPLHFTSLTFCCLPDPEEWRTPDSQWSMKPPWETSQSELKFSNNNFTSRSLLTILLNSGLRSLPGGKAQARYAGVLNTVLAFRREQNNAAVSGAEGGGRRTSQTISPGEPSYDHHCPQSSWQ